MVDWETFISPEVLQDTKVKQHQPKRYEVILHNDDYTPMEFVVDVLRAVFCFDENTATRIMMRVHYDGKASCGVFELAEAEQKAADIIALARDEGHPLLCTVELAQM